MIKLPPHGCIRGRRRAALGLAILALAAIGCGGEQEVPIHDPHTDAATYEITITNTGENQALLAPAGVTHDIPDRYFAPGTLASGELRELAENGDPGLIGRLWLGSSVRPGVLVVPDGRQGSGRAGSVSLTVSSRAGDGYLTVVAMLACTNDGVAALRSYPLPPPGTAVTTQLVSYDVGTERNSEDFDDLVPACAELSDAPGRGTTRSNPGIAETATIERHPGIAGGADLAPEHHGLTDPVAEVLVRNLG